MESDDEPIDHVKLTLKLPSPTDEMLEDPRFEAIWQRLILAQRAVLRAVVVQGGRAVLSADVRNRHRLGGTSTIQSALNALVRTHLRQPLKSLEFLQKLRG